MFLRMLSVLCVAGGIASAEPAKKILAPEECSQQFLEMVGQPGHVARLVAANIPHAEAVAAVNALHWHFLKRGYLRESSRRPLIAATTKVYQRLRAQSDLTPAVALHWAKDVLLSALGVGLLSVATPSEAEDAVTKLYSAEFLVMANATENGLATAQHALAVYRSFRPKMNHEDALSATVYGYDQVFGGHGVQATDALVRQWFPHRYSALDR